MNASYAIAYIEAWKTQDFNGVWSRDLTIPVRRSNQVSYEATDVGSWSFLGSNEPVRNECEWMSNDIWNVSYIELRIRHQVSYDPRSYERNLCNCVYRSLKKSGLNGVSTRNLPIPVRCSNQLSYKATDVGSW